MCTVKLILVYIQMLYSNGAYNLIHFKNVIIMWMLSFCILYAKLLWLFESTALLDISLVLQPIEWKAQYITMEARLF